MDCTIFFQYGQRFTVFLGKAVELIHWLTILAKNYPENTTFKLKSI